MSEQDAGCRCQCCGRHYRIDVMIPDYLWERIKPMGEPVGSGLLCGPCIMASIEEIGEFAAWKLERI